ncbi:MAG: hypothetical protein U0441_19050 [Polyangiaceae bacterium]
MEKKPRVTNKPSPSSAVLSASREVASEPDFDDTIARNRVVTILDAASVPRPPVEYKPTNPDARRRRLRAIAADHRAESVAALQEASQRDLRSDLGKYAPEPARAAALAERLNRTGKLVSAAQTLLTYAKEMEQIALSDAILFLEAENKQLQVAIEHEPHLSDSYTALQRFFDGRNTDITDGIARSNEMAVMEKALKERAAVSAKADREA